MICRPCLQQLLLRQSQRCFSQSIPRRKHGAVPVFHPTSSAQLDALLSSMRSTIFLPSHLIKAQHALLYRKKYHYLLTGDEPATVKLGDEVHQLHPLSHQGDEPPTAASFRDALHMMRELGDFKNLVPLLSGLKVAKRAIKPWQKEMAVRLANEAGRQSVVLECAQRVSETGLGLWDGRIAREAVWGAVSRLLHSPQISPNAVEKEEGENVETSKAEGEDNAKSAARHADSLWMLMHEPRHRPRPTSDLIPTRERDALARATDPRNRPEIIAVMLLVHAAAQHAEQTQQFAGLLLHSWANAEAELKDSIQEVAWPEANYALQVWTPVLAGLVQGAKVLGDGNAVSRQLRNTMREQVQKKVGQASDILKKGDKSYETRRGYKTYVSLKDLII